MTLLEVGWESREVAVDEKPNFSVFAFNEFASSVANDDEHE